ncbi:MAG: ATP-binding protein, partial [Desulfobacterales bacterium]|nr:ATP-binding protein [Desulfobacterales bacterium]
MTEKGWVWIAWSDTALLDDRGQVVEIISVGRDITSRKTAQEALAMAAEHKKMALVGQVAGKLAHDFNNILGGILGNAELSLLDCENEADRQSFNIIVDQAVRGRNLTRNLVAFAKDQEPKQEFFRAEEKLDLVLNLMKKDLEGIRVVRKYDPYVPELLADPGMIEHALVNLLQNSIHATSLAGSPEIVAVTRRENLRIIIEIRDNGCGIPEDFLDRIYDPSFTLKGLQDKTGAYRAGIKGTGYGLANVKKYIEQHRGTLSITSAVNIGTRVTISLPVVEKTLTKQERITVETMDWQKNRRILLVEDEQDIRDVQQRLLTQDPCRHRVDIAGDGQTAKDFFSKNACDLNRYDLVSLDYVLPGGISGMDVYHHIRETDTEVPVLFISGNLEFIASIKELKRQDPRTEHLSKPCRNMEYLKSVNVLLSEPAGDKR